MKSDILWNQLIWKSAQNQGQTKDFNEKSAVQSWRGNVWTKNDPDSVLMLVFSSVKGGAQIYMVHANTPDQFTEQWNAFYWKPVKKYLAELR